ncbi:sugar ABC transporter ATP-binding protein [Rhodococcoides kyotonense]|uniref:sugar ABC transporter ATP-binding protein n=1 Tax=Rhodococcoides kyotonense TaxID=398843 RepID=UPI00083997E9|nr:sugar ABC transporter ATP-binding protein [Rhodococcus kyotonensis]
MADALCITGLSKTFVGQRALDGIDLSLAPGEIRGLVGQNGCGKSTLIKVLAGYHDPDDGARIEVGGAELHLGVPGSGEAAGLRFVHQDLGLVESLDVVDNLALGHGYATTAFKTIDSRAERARARAALAELGFDLPLDKLAGSLSMSERTMLAVARAVQDRSGATTVLVLDEPTANLPAAEAVRLFDLVRRIRDRGVAVLFVSHHLTEVFSLCDSVTVMRDGKIVTTRDLDGLDEAGLVELMIGRRVEEFLAEPEATTTGVGSPVFEVSGLSCGALADLDFSVRSGEVLGIAGITGSGREQVVPALFGAEARAGVVAVEGRVVEQGRPDLAMSAGVGCVPAERVSNAAFVNASLRENVSVADPWAYSRYGFSRTRREKSDVAHWLERLGVRPAGDTERTLGTLSGGNQQKVVLARWLRRNPRVLLLDEPTQGVDVGAKADIHTLVDSAAHSGAAVLVVSTDHGELTRLCDRVIVLAGGGVVDEFTRPRIDPDRLTASTLKKPASTASSSASADNR